MSTTATLDGTLHVLSIDSIGEDGLTDDMGNTTTLNGVSEQEIASLDRTRLRIEGTWNDNDTLRVSQPARLLAGRAALGFATLADDPLHLHRRQPGNTTSGHTDRGADG